MGLSRYRNIILVVTASLALLVASPSIQQLLVYPQSENLTEFWMLGPNHDTTYPSNVTSDQTFRIYLGVTNHLELAAYYNVEIKFRNQTQSSPDSFNKTSSDLSALTSIAIAAAKNSTSEVPLEISFQYHTDNQTDTLYMETVTVNGFAQDASNTTIMWDEAKGGFLGNLVFELYINNSTTNSLQYHQRYLSLWFKMIP
ncbi:DUF1616 domain-containing protein [Candidatus Bathyarchaeota archaeon]|nr:DUF1616 domain-containing protein [Candidatus Bathyarchaeota archaeon]